MDGVESGDEDFDIIMEKIELVITSIFNPILLSPPLARLLIIHQLQTKNLFPNDAVRQQILALDSSQFICFIDLICSLNLHYLPSAHYSSAMNPDNYELSLSVMFSIINMPYKIIKTLLTQELTLAILANPMEVHTHLRATVDACCLAGIYDLADRKVHLQKQLANPKISEAINRLHNFELNIRRSDEKTETEFPPLWLDKDFREFLYESPVFFLELSNEELDSLLKKAHTEARGVFPATKEKGLVYLTTKKSCTSLAIGDSLPSEDTYDFSIGEYRERPSVHPLDEDKPQLTKSFAEEYAAKGAKVFSNLFSSYLTSKLQDLIKNTPAGGIFYKDILSVIVMFLVSEPQNKKTIAVDDEYPDDEVKSEAPAVCAARLTPPRTTHSSSALSWLTRDDSVEALGQDDATPALSNRYLSELYSSSSHSASSSSAAAASQSESVFSDPQLSSSPK